MIDKKRAMLLAALTLPLAAANADTSVEQELRRLIELQEQRIKVLERKLEIQDETAKTAVAATPVTKAGPKGYSFQSPDGANVIKFRGVLHADGARLAEDADLNGIDTWSLTRIRPTLEGTLGGIYDWRFTPDFGRGRTVIQDAYVSARFAPRAAVTIGKFKAPVGLERLQSASDMRFVQRAFPTSLAPNRDIGVQLSGALVPEKLDYQVAYLNGSNDGSSSESFATPDFDPNSGKDWAVRLFAHPFATSEVFALRGFGVGIAGTFGDETGDATNTLLPSFRTPGQQTFFRYASGTIADGDRIRLAPQAYYYRGSFGLLGEWTRVEQDLTRVTDTVTRSGSVDTEAWQIAMSWFVTGEEAKYRGYTPITSFTPSGDGWGALELKARYHVLDIGDEAFAGGADAFADPLASSSEASAWAVGFNWYLSQNIKWMFDYERTAFDGGIATGDRTDEDVIFGRVQLAF
jgi:phosphate-selective porin OprO and OprP